MEVEKDGVERNAEWEGDKRGEIWTQTKYNCNQLRMRMRCACYTNHLAIENFMIEMLR